MIQGVLLDLEGVLYVGGYPLPGAREALLSLRAAGIPMRFVTNITRLTRATLVNRLVGRHDNALTRVLSAPGMWLQNFTVNEPDDSMLEVAIEALKLVLPEEKGKDRW